MVGWLVRVTAAVVEVFTLLIALIVDINVALVSSIFFYLKYSLTKCCGLEVIFSMCLIVAFAELQIDMSEVANDILSSSGLPFRDYSHYSVRVLFAGDKWQTYIMPEYVT